MENNYREKVNAIDERMERQDREVAANTEQAIKDVEKTKREHEVAVKALEHSWAEKCRALEDKRAELEDKVAESEEKLRQVQMEILDVRIGREQTLQELESESTKETGLQIEAASKDLEGKLKTVEGGSEKLNRRVMELMEEIKLQQSKYSTMLLLCEKESNELKQEISNMQKEQSLKFSEGERMKQEIAITSCALEVPRPFTQ